MAFRWRTWLASLGFLLGLFVYIGLVTWLMVQVGPRIWLLLLAALGAAVLMPLLFAGLFRFGAKDAGPEVKNPD